ALHEALRIVLEEGLDKCFERHLSHHRALKAGLAAIGIRYATKETCQLPMLNAVLIPNGADDAKTRRLLLDRFGIEIGGGLGAFKGKAWRIGLMGHSARAETVYKFLAALEQLLAEQGLRVKSGASIAAANDSYRSS
ncbi:MAG: alanine--glyoxylate aminotransferase family protein, partial [Planctomycetales bacterium]